MVRHDRETLVVEALGAADPLGTKAAPELTDAELSDRLRHKVSGLLQGERPALEPTVRRGVRPVARYAFIALLAMATVVAATPQGRAVAERVAEVVGIGDEPTREADSPIDEPAVVIGAGRTPNGTPYEIVASGDMNVFRDKPNTCISLDLVDLNPPTNAACLTEGYFQRPDRDIVQPIAFLGPRNLGADRLIVDGFASPEVASADVEHRDSSGAVQKFPAVVAELGGELASGIDASREVNFIVAFLPDHLVPPNPAPSRFGPKPDPTVIDALKRFKVIARSSDGAVLARQTLGASPVDARILYAFDVDPRPEDQAILEDCAREVLPAYGRLGEIKPDLPARFGRELNRCVEERREAGGR